MIPYRQSTLQPQTTPGVGRIGKGCVGGAMGKTETFWSEQYKPKVLEVFR